MKHPSGKLSQGIFAQKLVMALLLIMLLNGCKGVFKSHSADEGVIKYKITYLKNQDENPLISLLPDHLNMYYKDNNVAMIVEGWMGIFKSSFIKKAETCEAVTVLKMLNKKYYYRIVTADAFMGMSGYKSPKITFDDKQKTVLGKTCKHAIVAIDSINLVFDIYYTHDIAIENPNKHTLYEAIPGVLMEFQLEMNGIPMRLEASEIMDVEVDNQVFEIPEGYEEVTKEKIDEMFASLSS